MMNRVQRSSTEILVDTITINYNRRNLHEPLRQQKALTGPLRFWAVMLLLLGLVLFTLAFYSHVVVWRHTYLSSTEKGWTTLRAVWTWSIAWHRLPVISPFLLGPWGLAFAYFYLASRLRRRPNDRTAIVPPSYSPSSTPSAPPSASSSSSSLAASPSPSLTSPSKIASSSPPAAFRWQWCPA